MATYKTSSLGYDLNFSGPDTIEEYDKLAGKSGAALEDAVFNEIYRGTLPEWGDKWATELKALTKIERAVNTTATEKARAAAKDDEARAKVKDVLETVKSYDLRVKAAVASGSVDGVTLDDLKASAQRIADGVAVNPAPTRKEGGVKKDFLEKAESLLSGDPDILEGKISLWLTCVDFDLQRDDATGRPLKESLARFIAKYMDWKFQQEMA